MPRRFSNPFASILSTPPPAPQPASEKQTPSRPPARGNRFVSYFSAAPKPRTEPQSAAAALLAASQPQSSAISQPSLSLPSISLSTATADAANTDEPPTTLFRPPSPAEARRIARQYAQFGPLGSQSHRYVSRHTGGPFPRPVEDEPPYFYLVTTYISYLVLILFGHVRDFFGKRFRARRYRHLQEQDGYAPLNSDFDSFYVRRLKLRLNDCFARPTTGVPGRYITLVDRETDDYCRTFKNSGTCTETLNLSSYNYLGYAQSEGACADAAEDALRRAGLALASPRALAGPPAAHVELEELVARFVGQPAAMVFSMGFATNATVFQALVGRGSLILSDELNHASIRYGARLSGAAIRMFAHNDMRDLERRLREAISQGQPRTHRPWKKILVVVEGLYSMEGTMCDLPALAALRDRYRFHLYVDEAHSIGALGPRGRGVADYFAVDPARVDVLMGTFTKSFGANGGYIAGSKALIDALRVRHAGAAHGESPAPAVLAQIGAALRVIDGALVPGQGEERLQRLAFNSRYLRLGLKRLGFIVYGCDDSPIVPILLYHPAKMPAFSREMLRRKISVVVVGYPATPLVTSRARICVSAAHTKDDLDRFLAACDEVGGVLQLKFSSGVAGGAEPLPEGVTYEMEREWRRNGKGLFGAELVLQKPRWKLDEVLKRGVQDVKMPLR